MGVGLEEQLEDWPGVALVEWAERFPEVLPLDHLELHLELLAPEGERVPRRATVHASGPESRARLRRWRVAYEAGPWHVSACPRAAGARRSGGRRRAPEIRARVSAMVVLLLVCVGLVLARTRYQRQQREVAGDALESEVIIEVRGAVPRPGYHAVPAPARVYRALAAAGVQGQEEGLVDAVLEPGTRLVVEADAEGALRVRLEPMDQLLVVGLPVDVNTASATALDAIPGVGPSRAQAIVSERERNGPYESVDALDRVRGIGPATVESLRPFVTVGPPTDG